MNQIETYLSHLWELGRNEMHRLDEQDYAQLTSRIIKATPTKLLPHFEAYDKEREIMLLMGEWMETENTDLGNEILAKMREYMITALTPQIEDRMADYGQRQGQGRWSKSASL